MQNQSTKSDLWEVTHLPIDQVERDDKQPRKDMGKIDDLKASIKEVGLINPILVSEAGPHRYRIIAGERRWRAAKDLGHHTIPARVMPADDPRRLQMQIIENIARKGLTALEEAQALSQLREQPPGLKLKEIAEKLGVSIPACSQTLKILELPSQILAEVKTSKSASKSVLIEIARMRTAKDQVAAWEKFKSGGLTVREARGETYQKRSLSHRIKLPYATVTVRLRREAIENDEAGGVRSVVSKALDEAREML